MRAVVGVFAACLFGAAPSAWALEGRLGGRSLSLTGHVEGREVFEVDRATARDHTSEEIWLRLRVPWSTTLGFESTVVGRNGGPTTEADGGGTYTFDDVFQSRSPSIEFEEAFIDVSVSDVDLRVGKQKFAWGKLDRVQPTDLLNTERYVDPFLLDEDQNKIGVPAVQVSYFVPARDWVPEEARLTAVWIPYYIPFRFPRFRERWFPPAAVPADTFVVPAGLVEFPEGNPNPSLEVPIGFRTRNLAAPSFGLANSGYAARFSAFTAGVDYALSYYHGFDMQPAFHLTAEVQAESDPGGFLGRRFSAQTELSPVFRRIDAWGGEAAYAWGRFTFRGEAAYVRGRPFARDLRFLIQDPRALAPQIQGAIAAIAAGATNAPIEIPPGFVERDALEWGLGVDYTMVGYTILVQINQTDVFDNHVDLLIEDVETRLTANLRKRFRHDDVEVQLIATYGVSSDYTLLQPRLTYRLWKGLELRLGYLFIAGRTSSSVGQYTRNDQGFVRLRYLF